MARLFLKTHKAYQSKKEKERKLLKLRSLLENPCLKPPLIELKTLMGLFVSSKLLL